MGHPLKHLAKALPQCPVTGFPSHVASRPLMAASGVFTIPKVLTCRGLWLLRNIQQRLRRYQAQVVPTVASNR
jgi:hypothetical protein